MMALDPRWFEGFGPLPSKGDMVSCETSRGRRFGGRVLVVWLAMDTPCIDVQTSGGQVVGIFPEFGDRWWPETDPEAVAVWSVL